MRAARLSVFAGLVAGGTACAAIIGLEEGTPRGAASTADDGSVDALAPGSDDAAPALGYRDIRDPAAWQTFRLETLPPLPKPVASFNGALFDGQRVTFIPRGACDSGTIASFDVSKPFGAASSWNLFDLRTVDDDARGYAGGAFDGKRLYFAPNCLTADGTLLGGTGGASVATHDVAVAPGAGWTVHSTTNAGANAIGYRGAVYDGHNVYYAPSNHGLVVRYDTTLPTSEKASFTKFDTLDLTPAASTFAGAVFDGQYIYFAPGPAETCTTVVARYDTKAAFDKGASWSSFDLAGIDAKVTWCRYGGVFDGHFVYLVPYGGQIIVRLDVSLPFATATSWTVFDLAKTTARGTHFGGAAFDGRFVYLVPAPGSVAPSVVLRFDTLVPFTDPASWSSFDLATLGGGVSATGFIGAAFDGRWVYFAPAAAPFTAARFDARSPTALPPSYRGSFL